MYGLIHQAARSMALELFGDDGWRVILGAAALTDDDFLTMHHYEDDKTFALVGAIAAHAKLDVADALKAFGRYWIGFADSTHYASVMRLSGDTIEEFVANLDRMHAAIGKAIPGTRLPSFRLIEAQHGAMTFSYYSTRPGLEPFVVGLFEGLYQRYGLVGVIGYTSDAANGHGVTFTLAYTAATEARRAAS